MRNDVPVYLQLLQRLGPTIARLSLSREDREGWVVLRGSNGQRVAVSRTRTGLPTIETTLPPHLCGDPGEAEPVRDNGRIRCRIKPAVIHRHGVPYLEALLELLVDPELPVAPPRRGGTDRAIPSLDSLLAVVVEEVPA